MVILSYLGVFPFVIHYMMFKDFLILKETDLTQLLAAMADNNSKDSLQRKKQLEEEISRIGKLIGSL